jgi:hypothetical protein
MPTATAAPRQTSQQGTPQSLNMQGIEVPASAKNPDEFFKSTRRLRFKQATIGAIQGLGNTDTITLKQTGIIAAIDVKIFGNLVVTLGGGTCASTARWPYDLIKRIRLSANGQSNLVNVSGCKLRARELAAVGDASDRGVIEGIGGASPGTQVGQGTMAQNSESWGVGQNVTAIPGGTYDVELALRIPVAWDMLKLVGSIFAQTAATNLEVSIDWAPTSDLFTLTGAATAVPSFGMFIDGVVFSIPEVDGHIVVPDLSVFHGMTQNNDFTLGSGSESELNLVGQGVGRQLMRIFWQVWNGAAPQVPLALNAANFGPLAWRYGGNDTPEFWGDGRVLRMSMEKLYDCDMGAQGFGIFDFASQWAMRDSIDEGAATNLRIVLNCLAALTASKVEIVQETIFSGAVGA